MSARKNVEWGVLIGETVRPLPKAENVTQALLMADKPSNRGKRGNKPVVVYRDDEHDMWKRHRDKTPVPTQLALFDQEAS
ncbi:hypothetical protein [Nocardia noduli]|uniref:hypothetical protein n=1 Tax=Nocardia noduli TaxID=2815722 RepID=UPI001C23A8D3|nr:hypothetical protein [Nocardia noduli]